MKNSITLSIVTAIVGSLIAILIAMSQLAPKISVSNELPACSSIVEMSNERELICKQSYNNKLREYRASYDKWSLENRGKALAWQHLSAILMFILFALVLVFGLFLTYKEFTKETKDAITLSLGNNGISITSEIVGVVILVISLAFTFVYVDRVFPISEVNVSKTNK